MADAPSGRARGRGGRGRGRGQPRQQQQVGRPAAAAAAAPPGPADDVLPTPGRGRSRGGSAQPPAQQQTHQQQQPPPQHQQQHQQHQQPRWQQQRMPQGAGTGEPQLQQQFQQMSIQQTREGVGGISSRQRREQISFTDPKTRPAHVTNKEGTSGVPVRLKTNTFKLTAPDDWRLYQYHVSFNPSVDSKRLRQFLVRVQSDNLLGKALAFDGMVLYLTRLLPQKETKVFSQMKDGTNIEVCFTLTNELPSNSPTCLQVYNIIFRKVLSMLGFEQVGRHYYNPARPANIPQHKLTLWPGFITSILKYEKEVMLMADVSHKILRSDTVLDILYDIIEKRDKRMVKEEATRMLVGAIVLTEYNNKTYRVDDIDWDKNPTSTFKKFDGSEISYVEYYAKNYEKKIKDLGQPLLLSRPKKKEERQAQARGQELGDICLIPELCMLTGLSDEARANFTIMKDIATYTRISPDKRIETLMQFNQEFSRQDVVDYTSQWGLSFGKRLHEFDGRTLPAEKMRQRPPNARGNKDVPDVVFNYKPADADWGREMRNQHLMTAVDLMDWAVLYTRRDENSAKDFVMTMQKVSKGMGMRVGDPGTCRLDSDNAAAYIQTIKSGITPTTQMIVCILPTNRKDRYDAIKKCCCLDHPVPSQVILGRTLSKKQQLMSVCTKIAMQINCKLGGELWAVEIPLKNTMVIGLDNYHDSSTRGRSVCGVVCTMNKDLTRYYSQVTFQHSGQELIDGLKPILTDALTKYKELNGVLPERILVYRDGVGDGQLPAVVEHELPQMLETLQSVGPAYQPRVAVIVVKKRINNRFFFCGGRGHSNPPPGTIIDKDVTKEEMYDFFLVSQSVRQGTVTPTHYNVIWDQTGLKPDHIQRLTYKLCHLYFNWPGTIRVPAPCLYAHKLAFLVGQSLHKKPDLSLANRLFFL